MEVKTVGKREQSSIVFRYADVDTGIIPSPGAKRRPMAEGPRVLISTGV